MDWKIKFKLFKRFELTKYITSNKIGRSFQIVVTSLEYMNFKENTFYSSKSNNQKIIILIHKDFELNVLDEEGRSLSKAIKTILLMILRLGVISMCIHVCIIRIPYFLI